MTGRLDGGDFALMVALAVAQTEEKMGERNLPPIRKEIMSVLARQGPLLLPHYS